MSSSVKLSIPTARAKSLNNIVGLASAFATAALITAGAIALIKLVSSNTSYASSNALNTTELVNNSLEAPCANTCSTIT
jgi:hypothetical protein